MSTAAQIEAYVRPAMREAGLQFRGVFPSDQLPPDLAPGQALIANYDPAGKGGSHWISICWPPSRPVLVYFDSFGFGPDRDDDILKDRTHFRRYLEDLTRQRGQSWAFEKEDWQSLDASTCGHWSSACAVWGPPSQPYSREGAEKWQQLRGTPQPQRDALIRRLVPLN